MRSKFVNTRKYFGGSKFKFSCFTVIANDFFGEGGLRIDFESTQFRAPERSLKRGIAFKWF